ncbi:Btz domain-containing protein [Mycena venus]|uniref:Btz domain-containing protein n=1 Tax=Mycena venus TaxID=2733690 RepID=A0A8H6Y5A0_9AGAR|nr:Btz domain-containing protein [Mycena venus]
MPSKRPTRRRGRAPHASDSDDDEIERAAQTDSEEEESHDSQSESDSDTDSEPVSRHLTPNTSHSPGADEKPAPFFAATPAAWSDMVEEAASLPVIAFGELDANAVRKVRMAEPQPDSTDDEPEQDPQPVASSSRHSPAPPSSFVRSQSARQAYQHRLDSDPSFVPVVGEFWGHDDRLLDKDLRSLSGWWRGRWQGRGRARGAFPPRGRGRGGFNGPSHLSGSADAEPVVESPVDRAWTHDGYEEMQRRREETRVRPPIPRGGAPLRGAPAFRARGTPPGRVPGRIWFTMKPEHMWTKQHDAFLYFDPALKPRPGQPPGVRVRLPGGAATIVRAIPRPNRPARSAQKVAGVETEYVVRLPRAGKGKATSPTQDEAFTVKLPPPPSAPISASPPTNANPLQPDADGWVQPTPAAVALAAAASPPAAPASALPAQAQAQIQQQLATAAPPPFYPFAPPPGFAFPPGPTRNRASQHTLLLPPPPGFSTHTPPPGFGTPPPFNAPLPPGVALDARGMPFELASGRPVVLQAPVPPVPVPVMYGAPYPGHHHAHSMSMGHAHHPSMSISGHGHHPSIGGPDPSLFSFARPGRVEIRAPGAKQTQTQTLQATSPRSPLSPGRPSPLSPLSPRKDLSVLAQPNGTSKQLRTGAAAFVPSHGGTPSVSLSVSLPSLSTPGAREGGGATYFGNGYVADGGVNGYEGSGGVGVNGGAYDANGTANGNAYDHDPYGGYGHAPQGATYYFPYYAPQQHAPAADGTVYYQ